MGNERILALLGYDSALVARMSEKHRGALRGAAVSWLSACLILAGASAYAAWLILPGAVAPIVGGISVALLTVNLLRVVHAGGGSRIGNTLEESEDTCRTYRPSLIPALVFGVLAMILAQPAQIPFWSDIEPEVEEHRRALIDQHNVAATHLGTDADYYRAELEAAGFPIFRIKRIWQDPKRAVRLTVIVLVLVLLPAVWSQLFAIESVRAYQWQRSKRAHHEVLALQRGARSDINELLSRWETHRSLSRGALLGRRSI